MAIARQIVGPQAQFERSGAQSLRDIRPLTTRLSEALRGSASFVVLATAAVATWFEPAVIDLTVPASVLYATWVLTRRPSLPIRLPRSAECLDYGNPQPGSRKPQRAKGGIFVGWSIEGQELWVTAEDARQHISIPGTTGAGKTTAILEPSVECSRPWVGFRAGGRQGRSRPVRQGDGAGTAFWPRGRCARAELHGGVRGQGQRHASIPSRSATPTRSANCSPASWASRRRTTRMACSVSARSRWSARSRRCWSGCATKGLSLNIEVIRSSIELRWIWKLAIEKRRAARATRTTGTEREIDVSAEIPEDVIWPLVAYLGELPGYDPTVPLSEQKGDEPSKQHGFAQFYFTGDVHPARGQPRPYLPGREWRYRHARHRPQSPHSRGEPARAGKFRRDAWPLSASWSSPHLRGMMAQLLGASLEGEYSEADKPGMGSAPFPVVLDELAYYATSGLDRMLAMGRGLNISFMLGFQETSGIWARLGEKTASLLGNANFTIAMRQQDSGRTREWLQKTAGETFVTQATSYQGSEDGNYREARHAEVRPVSRVDWQDLTSLIEGEAIVLFGGRRVYARVFHAVIDDSGPKRLGRCLMVREPDPALVREHVAQINKITETIARGSLALGQEEALSATLGAMLRGFQGALNAGKDLGTCARDALLAIDQVPEASRPPPPSAPADGTPVTSVMRLLDEAADSRIGDAGSDGAPHEPVDIQFIRRLQEIEREAGAAPGIAREIALSILTARDEALQAGERIEPPAMSHEAFLTLIGRLRRRLRQAASATTQEAA